MNPTVQGNQGSRIAGRQAIPLPPQKRTLRTFFRRKRRALSAIDQRRHAEAVAHAAIGHLAATDTVAAYYAHDGEVDLAPLAEMCWQRGIEVALPVLAGPHMAFAAYCRDTVLRHGRHGIQEPASTQPALEPNVVLAPLVAFDAAGNRLGMGGGHYDRYLAAHPTALRVGVAHECQQANVLPNDSGDVRLGVVVTERGWRAVRREP